MKRLVILAIVLAVSVPAWSQQTVVCESNDGRYKQCDLSGIGRVIVTRQLSDTNCVEGKTWGSRNNVVWVDKGCRAEFALTERGFDNRGNRVPRNERRNARQNLVTCESSDGRLHRCSVATGGGVSLVNQISRSACEFNRDWGYDDTGIWVDNGCRAEFAIANRRAMGPASGSSTFLCESNNNTRNVCRVDTMYGVQIYRQLSDNDCVLGRTWGYDRDGVWVSGGCRAEFLIGDMRRTSGMASSSRATTVVCESQNNGRQHCSADTRYGVSLSRQLSKSSCDFRSDWGFDQDGIWVDNGCRAEFALEGR